MKTLLYYLIFTIILAPALIILCESEDYFFMPQLIGGLYIYVLYLFFNKTKIGKELLTKLK